MRVELNGDATRDASSDSVLTASHLIGFRNGSAVVIFVSTQRETLWK